MNNNIFNRSFLILIFLSFIISNNLIAKEKSAEKKSVVQKTETTKPSLMLLKSYYNYYFENHYSTNSKNMSSSEEQTCNKKSPVLAFGLSLVWPGLGQIYNGDFLKALIIDVTIVLGVVGFILAAMSTNYDSESNPDWIGVLLYSSMGISFGAWLYSIIDAPISANNINERIKQSSKIKVLSSSDGKYSINLGYSKFTKSYLVGIKYNL